MKNVLIVVSLIVLVLTGLLWMTWHLAFGMGNTPTGNVSVDALKAPVNVYWDDRAISRIEASSEEDALAGLGFVHAAQHPWRLLLWRQTALGELGQWMGDSVLVLDAHTRQLGLDRIAFDSYRQMDAEHKALLDAYARGINAALAQRNVHLNDALISLNLRDLPEWAPWHTLALERLVGWATTPLPQQTMLDSLATPDSLVQGLRRALMDSSRVERDRFIGRDRQLRDFLYLRGFENSVAWTAPTRGGTFFAQRHVYGANALPFFQDVVVEWSGRRVYLTSIPGTLMFPAGRDASRAWSVLLGSRSSFAERDARNRPQPLFARVRSAHGVERLIESERTADGLLFMPAADLLPSPPDTSAVPTPTDSLGNPRPFTPAPPPIAAEDTLGTVGWQLTWEGFRMGTDWPAWRHLWRGVEGWPVFSIQSGTGLTVGRDGQTSVYGNPAVVERMGNAVLVGTSPRQRYLATRLNALVASADSMTTPADWTADTVSPWAADLAPAMTSILEDRDDLAANVDSARTYLANWDASYDEASIAASIFEAWMQTYQDSLGTLPSVASVRDALAQLEAPIPEALPATADTPGEPDPEAFAQALLRESLSDLYVNTLSRAVAWLEAEFGTDQSQWRWENVQPTDRHFAGWHEDFLAEAELRDDARGRYRPIETRGVGHPTTLRWGPALRDAEGYAPGVRSVWLTTRDWDEVFVRRNDPRTGGFLARYLPTEDRLRPHVVDLTSIATRDPDVRLRPTASR